MVVVASTTNTIDDVDMTTMMKDHEVGRNISWYPVFKRNCKEVVVVGDSWHSLVSIRGSLFDTAGYFTDHLLIGKTRARCPIHKICSVCRMGNKSIVDVVLAIDPTLIERKDSTWTFEIDFPLGFTPMCYASKTRQNLHYLAIHFQSLGIVAVDISPVSFTLLWDIPESCSVRVNSEVVATGQLHKMEVLNAYPENEYEIVVYSEESDKMATIRLTTPRMSEETMNKFYLSRSKGHDNVFDLRGVRDDTIKYLREKGILKSGHVVCLEECNSTVVLSGETVPLSSKASSVYVVPDFDLENSGEQFICLEEENCGTSFVLEFDSSESYVKYGEEVFQHGKTFSIFDGSHRREISVVKGSIILVISDSVQEFPGGEVAASQVLTSGDLVVRDLIMRSSFQVCERVEGDSTFGRNSFYVYNPDTGTTTECTRVSHGLNEEGNTGSMAIDVLYTDDDSNQYLVNTITSNPIETSITARSSSESVTATFSASGLSFDSDNGNIYFGADKDFRIHYAEATGLDPAMLQIQSLLPGDNSEYITRFLITAEPP